MEIDLWAEAVNRLTRYPFVVSGTCTSLDDLKQNLRIYIDGVATQQESDFDFTFDEVDTLQKSLVTLLPLEELRKVRDKKLLESDWTRLDDCGLSDSVKSSWATYRQALRDITDSATSLDDVTWPTKP